MANVSADGDVKIKVGTGYDGKGIDAAEDDLGGLGRKSSSVADKMMQQWDKLQKNWLKVVAAIFAVRKAWDLAAAAAKFDQQEQAFTNLAASHGANAKQIIADLKAMSGQTVSTAQVMESAGSAMLLGIPADKLSKMMEIARASSRITGQSIQKSFSDIATGIGRQSPLILDNLGIIVRLDKAYQVYAEQLGVTVSQLDDAQKKQAFLNAVMASGEEIVQRVGAQSMTAAEGMAMFTAKLNDAKIFIGKLLISITSFISSGLMVLSATFAATISEIFKLLLAFEKMASKLPFVGKEFKALSGWLKEVADFEAEAALKAKEMAKSSAAVAMAVFQEKEAVGALTEAQIKQKDAAAEVVAQKKADEEASKEFQKVNKGLITDINNMNDAYSKAILTDRQYILMKAEEMEADEKSTALIKQWTAAKMEALELQEREALIKEQKKEVEEAVDTSTQEFEQLQLQMEQKLLMEEEFENLRHERQLELMEQRMLLIDEEGLLTAELEEQFRVAKENAELIHQQKITDINNKENKKRMKLEQQASKAMISIKKNVATNAIALIRAIAPESKAAALIGIAISKFAAISASQAATLAAGELAFASQLIPGDPTSLARAAAAKAAVLSAGALNVGLIAATGLVEAAGVLGLGRGEQAEPGTAGGEPIFTQPASDEPSNVFNTSQPEQPPQIIHNTTINVDGNIVDQAAFARELRPFLGEADDDRVAA